jgi:hypothetical protein
MLLKLTAQIMLKSKYLKKKHLTIHIHLSSDVNSNVLEKYAASTFNADLGVVTNRKSTSWTLAAVTNRKRTQIFNWLEVGLITSGVSSLFYKIDSIVPNLITLWTGPVMILGYVITAGKLT